jgi:hypothetical protein
MRLPILAGNKMGDFFMRKSKFLVLGLIALMLAGGLILVGCDGLNCPGGSNPNFKPGYDVGSNKGGCTFKGSTESIRDCQDRCLERYADKYPYATSFTCNC